MAKQRKQFKKKIDTELTGLAHIVEAYKIIESNFWILGEGGKRRTARYIVDRFGDFIHAYWNSQK